MEYIKCCAICGCTINLETSLACIDCKGYRETTKEERILKDIHNRRLPIFYTSRNPKEYYEKQSQQLYGTPYNWKELFVEQELSKNPEFSKEKYLVSLNLEKERNERAMYRKNHPEEKLFPNYCQPKCPTCNSTNVTKTSELTKLSHAFAFGLFSKTAKSQFKCNNCGYKW